MLKKLPGNFFAVPDIKYNVDVIFFFSFSQAQSMIMIVIIYHNHYCCCCCSSPISAVNGSILIMSQELLGLPLKWEALKGKMLLVESTYLNFLLQLFLR